jgi:Methyltransferase domain
MPELSARAWRRRVRRVLGHQPPPAAAKKAPPRKVADSDQPRCLVCRSVKLREKVIVNRRDEQRTMTVVLCGRCRYVSLPDNAHDYMAATSTVDLAGTSRRCGTVDTPGRETAMAKLALQVLGRRDASVLVYGAGQSLDVHHIAGLPRSGRVAIGDLVEFRDDAEFVDISKPATTPFDVVIACEVVEHFTRPHKNFANLFSYVADDGIVVASTNVRDKLPIGRIQYIWHRGHVSYYSSRALRIIARRHGMHVDFRVPLVATGTGGPRKRYLIFSRSSEVMDSVSDWFGGHMYAPSEPPD